jgi:hypothetical protein
MQLVQSFSAPSKSSVAVDVRALLKRINRKLAHENYRVLRAHPNDRVTVGDYFMVDENNITVECWIDPEELGRHLGLLKDFEAIASE